MWKVCFYFIVIAYSFSSFSLSCNIDNYKDFIYNDQKTDELIEQTGKGCKLFFVNFREANLRRANLIKASLVGSDLQKANLHSANLRGADLREANLHEADFRKADLRGADLRKTNLSTANFRGALYNDATNFPGFDWRFNPEEKGMIYKD